MGRSEEMGEATRGVESVNYSGCKIIAKFSLLLNSVLAYQMNTYRKT